MLQMLQINGIFSKGKTEKEKLLEDRVNMMELSLSFWLQYLSRTIQGKKKNKLLIVAWHIALMSKKRILDPTGKVKTI